MSESVNEDRNSSEPVGALKERNIAVRLRLSLLSALLCVMLAALWYDYRVARPSVEAAFETITQLNNAMNSAKSFELTNRKNVQRALGRQPSRLIQHGIYTIEVYEWPAGMPLKINLSGNNASTFGLRTHDYYAVYLGNALQRHYKFAIPEEEWQRVNDQSVAQLLARIAKAQQAMKTQSALQGEEGAMSDAEIENADPPRQLVKDDEAPLEPQQPSPKPASSTSEDEAAPVAEGQTE